MHRARSLHRRLRHGAALLLLAALCGCAATSGRLEIGAASPHLLWAAEMAITDSATPPPEQAAWQPVALPDSWRGTPRYRQGLNGWYRIRVPGPAPAEPSALYLWRLSMNAAVWFNGQFVGDGGSFDEPVARNWNRPLIFGLPAPLWRDGENTVLIRLRVYPGFGHLMPVAVGPMALLQADHERRTFAQVTLSQVAAGITLLALLSGAILWLIDRGDDALPYFIGFCLAWFVYGANTFVRDIPVSAETWWWAVHTAVDACYWLVVCLFHRLLGVRRPKIEHALLAWVLLCSALYALFSLPQLARWNPLLHAVSALSGVYLSGWLLWQFKRRRTTETLLFALIFIAIFAGGLHDQLLNALLLPDLWRSRYYLLHLVMPLMFLGLIALLALRTARSMGAVRAANLNLEARVQAASEQIAGAYEREREFESERAATHERERIYRDLHDNLGARLLSLVYSAREPRQEALARAALADMRTLIATSQVAGAALTELATDWRVEVELRCEDAGLRLDWQLDGDAGMSGRQRYQVERVLRELVSNAIEHAAGSCVQVNLSAADGELRLTVGDDGAGVAEPDRLHGQGIAGVRQRAAELGGSVRWHRGASGGTRCELRFALAAEAGAGAGAAP